VLSISIEINELRKAITHNTVQIVRLSELTRKKMNKDRPVLSAANT